MKEREVQNVTDEKLKMAYTSKCKVDFDPGLDLRTEKNAGRKTKSE